MENKDYLLEGFINQAKPALNRHSGSGGSGGGSGGGGSKLAQTLNKSITEITAADLADVKAIPSSMFTQCKSLTSVVISNSVTSIGDSAFSWCDLLTSVKIGNGVITIGNQAFWYCKSLESFVIPDGVTTIGKEAFAQCSAASGTLTIPNSVTNIGAYAFNNTAFSGSITIPASVTTMGTHIFANCKFESAIYESTVNMPDYLFQYCRSLKKVKVLSSPQYVARTFYECNALQVVDFSNATAVPTMNNTQAFYYVPKACKIVIPDELYDTWTNATNWSALTQTYVKASEYVEE